MIEKLQLMTLMVINDLTTPRRDDKGATAVEYGLLVALIAAVIIVAVATLGTKVNTAFGVINSNLP